MKLILLLLPFLILIIFPPLVKAEKLLAQASPSASIAASPSARTLSKMENLRNRANLEIDRRIQVLNRLLTKIGAIKKLSLDQKNSLSESVSAEITALTALKAKIALDTDFATLKTDVKSIVSSYRIFALFVPKIQILGMTDSIINTASKSASLAAMLQTKLDQAEASGKDVSSLKTQLLDMQDKINQAEVLALEAQSLVIPLTPDGYPGNKTVLQSARTKLRIAHKNLETAKQIAKRISQELKLMVLRKNRGTASESARSFEASSSAPAGDGKPSSAPPAEPPSGKPF